MENTPSVARPVYQITNRIEEKINKLFAVLEPVIASKLREADQKPSETALISTLQGIDNRLADLLDSIVL